MICWVVSTWNFCTTWISPYFACRLMFSFSFCSSFIFLTSLSISCWNSPSLLFRSSFYLPRPERFCSYIDCLEFTYVSYLRTMLTSVYLNWFLRMRFSSEIFLIWMFNFWRSAFWAWIVCSYSCKAFFNWEFYFWDTSKLCSNVRIVLVA